MGKINVTEDGKYLYSWLFEIEGKDLEILTGKDIGSMAGEPRRISISMDSPNVVASNPSKRLSKEKRYKIIIVETDLVDW